MTQAHLDVVRANSEAFSRSDVDAMLRLYAADACVVDRRPVGWSSEFREHDALRAYYQGIFDNVAALHEDLEVVAVDGDRIVASCRLTVSMSSDVGDGELSFAYALVITFAGGLIQTLEVFADVAAASAEKRLG